MLSKVAAVAFVGADARLLHKFLATNEVTTRTATTTGGDGPNRSMYGSALNATTTTTVAPLTFGKDLAASKAEFVRTSEAGIKHQDNFLPVGCVNDGMLNFGDKHGNKQEFEHPISVIRYDTVVHKNDQQPMTPDVCFKFCRNFEHAKFFGVRNGAECYCAPYFDIVAGADEDCKIACPGDSSKFCGAQQKSSMFSMSDAATNQDFLAPEYVTEEKALVAYLMKNARTATDVPMAILNAGQALSKGQGSKGNMLATKHHEIMESSHKDYVKKVDDLPNAFRAVQAANEAITAYEQGINGATPVKAEELVKGVVDTMVPVQDMEYGYEQLVHKLVVPGEASEGAALGCFSGWLPYYGHGRQGWTKDSCQEYCTSEGYALYGLSWSGYCDCGNTIEGYLSPKDSGCTYRNSNDPNAKWGGFWETYAHETNGKVESTGKLELYQTVKSNSTTMCDGEPIQPVMAAPTGDACAARCQETLSPAKCIGFQYYKGIGEGDVCMMFSKMSSYVHYTGEACSAGPQSAECFVQKTELEVQRALKDSADTQAVEACFN